VQVADRCKNVEVNTFVWLATLTPTLTTTRLTAPTEINSDDPKSSCCEYFRQLFEMSPTRFRGIWH